MTPNTPSPETNAQLEAAYDLLAHDFSAMAADLCLLVDELLGLNELLQQSAVAQLLREREHERRVLAELVSR